MSTKTKLESLEAERLESLKKLRAAEERALKATGNTEIREADVQVQKFTLEVDEIDEAIRIFARDLAEERSADDAFARAAEVRGNGGNTEVRFDVPMAKGASFTALPGAKRNASLDDFGNDVWSKLGGENRSQSEGTDSAGGYLVPTKWSAPILDLVVNQMQVRAAGAILIPMSSKKVSIARLDSDPVPAWRLEGDAIAESGATFGSVDLIARSLSVHIKVSLELGEDASPDFGSILGTSLARAFALEADRVALYGSGIAPQPLGLKDTSGVTITPMVGANGGTFSEANGWYTPMVNTVARLKDKGYTPSGIIYSPRTEAQFGLATDTTNQPLQTPAYLKDAAPHLVTAQVPKNLTLGTSNDTSDFIVGDFRYMLVGMRTSLVIRPVEDALLLSSGQTAFYGWMRMAVAIARPGAFEILNGLRA